MEGVKGRKFLVAVDETEQSMYALQWAIDNLKPTTNDTLVLCHVKRTPAAGSGCITPEVVRSLETYENHAAEDVMKKARDVWSGRQVKVEEKIVSGDARESLCDAVKSCEADFLVIGSHGYGIIKRAVLGSVSDYCAHHAKCPVLIVKKPHPHH